MADIETVGLRTSLDEALVVVSQWLYIHVTALPYGPPTHCTGYNTFRVPQVVYTLDERQDVGPGNLFCAIMGSFSSFPLHVQERQALLGFLSHFKKMLVSSRLEHTYDTNGYSMIPMGSPYDGKTLIINYNQLTISLEMIQSLGENKSQINSI